MCNHSLEKFPSPPKDKFGWPWTEESSQLPEVMPDGNPWPKISIVTPSYNQGQFIEETMRSVLLQGYPNLEYIIIDGGSTDGSVKIIKKYEPWLTYWESELDRGQSHAINKGLAKSTGDIFNWLNSDDCYFPDAIQAVANTWLRNPMAGAWAGGAQICRLDGKILFTLVPEGDGEISFRSISNDSARLSQPSFFVSRQAIENLRVVNERLHYSMDRDWWHRIAMRFSIVPTDQIFSRIIFHDRCKTRVYSKAMWVESAMIHLWYQLCNRFPQIFYGPLDISEEISQALSPHYFKQIGSKSDEDTVRYLFSMWDRWYLKQISPKIPNRELRQKILASFEFCIIYNLLAMKYPSLARRRLIRLFNINCIVPTLRNQKSLILRLLFGEKTTMRLKALESFLLRRLANPSVTLNNR